MDLLVSILSSLGVNESFYVMLGIFLGTFVIVYLLAIRKLAYVVTERDHRTAGREEEAAELKAEHTKTVEAVRAGIFQARAEASNRFGALQAKALDNQRQIILAARDQAMGELKNVRADVSKNVQAEMTKIGKEIPVLAKKIAEQLAGEQGGAN